MIFRAVDLYEKEVICIKDGTRLGMITDFEVNSNGYIETIIIIGKNRLFGLLGREDDRLIPWSCVQVIGDDIILVDFEPPRMRRKCSKSLMGTWFD